MPTSVILSARRTPIGRFGGGLSTVPAPEMGAVAIRAALDDARLPRESIDEVIMGNVLSAGVGQAPARQAALRAGLPPSVSSLTVNMVCGSGMRAIMLADQAIRCGDAQAVVAGGMESMSLAPMLLARRLKSVGDQTLVDSMLRDGLTCAFTGQSMGLIAEALATSAQISRRAQDEFAVESHRRASAAVQDEVFTDEITPVSAQQRKSTATINVDEGPRSDTSVEALSRLRTAFSEDGSITPGNSSMLSDGAAALVIASDEFALRHGVAPLARITSHAVAGTAPEDLFVAPVQAVRVACELDGKTPQDIDLLEINEAFAVQMLACLQQLGLSHQNVNVRGGAIALGHPIGASGARIVTTLVHAMRRRGDRRGLASACLGGGNAVAMMITRDD